MRLGILGTGMIVSSLMEFKHKLPFEKIYVLGTKRSRQKANDLVTANHLDGAFFEYDALLESDVDTVYVALPNFLHCSFAKRALSHGKNVIIEKPVTVNVTELRELIALAENKNVMMVEAMNVHHLPAYRALKDDLPNVGRTRIVIMNYSQYSSRYDAFKRGEVLPAFDPKKAGGALMDLNVYNLHALVGLFGRPTRIYYAANIERGIDTSGIVTLQYPDFTAVCIGAKDCGAPIMCTIQGDSGTLRVDSPMSQMTGYSYLANTGQERTFAVSAPEHRLYYEFVEFIRMFESHDTKKMRELLDISLTVTEIMEQARGQAGLVSIHKGQARSAHRT